MNQDSVYANTFLYGIIVICNTYADVPVGTVLVHTEASTHPVRVTNKLNSTHIVAIYTYCLKLSLTEWNRVAILEACESQSAGTHVKHLCSLCDVHILCQHEKSLYLHTYPIECVCAVYSKLLLIICTKLTLHTES